jgi:hypothetical protein
MNLAQIKVMTWVACGLAAAGVGYLAYTSSSKERPQPEPEYARRLLGSVEPLKQQKADVVNYGRLKELLADANLTGKAVVAAKPVEAGEPAKPSIVPVSELVRVQYVQVDMARPESGATFLKYKSRAGVSGPAAEGALLKVGDRLAAPNGHVRIHAVEPMQVVFAFDDEAREKESVSAAEFESSTSIVQVGPDGVVVSAPRVGIPRAEGAAFVPGRTTMLGANRFVLGSEDMTYLNDNYADVLAREVRTAQHRDPRTGKYDGIEIKEVTPGSVAARHGAQSGDVIKSINGNPVNSVQEAISFVKVNKDKYSSWEVVIENKGKQRTVTYESPNR